MLKPTGHFWQERVRRVNDYERATFTATVTAVYSDAVYDVEVSATGARFYDVNNGTPYAFSVGDVVVVARLGGGRGNRHCIVAPAGRGNLAVTPGGGGGGSSGQTQSLSEVVKARSSDIYGAKSDLDARIECVDAEVALARLALPSNCCLSVLGTSHKKGPAGVCTLLWYKSCRTVNASGVRAGRSISRALAG